METYNEPASASMFVFTAYAKLEVVSFIRLKNMRRFLRPSSCNHGNNGDTVAKLKSK